MTPALATVQHAIERCGLAYRGAFHPVPEDFPDRRAVGTLVLVGFTGNGNWRHFRNSAEAGDGAPDALDRWSARVIGGMAFELGAAALFPFTGPPWLPFLRWGQKAGPLHPSPLGMLIHPDWGLWHAFRGALAFREIFDLPPPDLRPRPCDTCVDKPCLSACPVGAFGGEGDVGAVAEKRDDAGTVAQEPQDGGAFSQKRHDAGAFAQTRYDVGACVVHISGSAGADCMAEGCRARRACPVGAAHRYEPEEASFHMHAFRKAQV